MNSWRHRLAPGRRGVVPAQKPAEEPAEEHAKKAELNVALATADGLARPEARRGSLPAEEPVEEPAEKLAEQLVARPTDVVARQTPTAVPGADVNSSSPVNEMLQRATLAREQVAGRPSGLFNVEKGVWNVSQPILSSTVNERMVEPRGEVGEDEKALFV